MGLPSLLKATIASKTLEKDKVSFKIVVQELPDNKTNDAEDNLDISFSLDELDITIKTVLVKLITEKILPENIQSNLIIRQRFDCLGH